MPRDLVDAPSPFDAPLQQQAAEAPVFNLATATAPSFGGFSERAAAVDAPIFGTGLGGGSNVQDQLPVDVTLGSQSNVRNTTDANDLIGNSATNTGVWLQQRSPISYDPRVRAYRYAQIRSQAANAFFYPVRPDLDTALSKIDSSIIQDVVVVKGPYTVRRGPGFAFIDVNLLPAPRYQNGFEVHGRSAFVYDTNGEQYNGRQTFFGGNSDYGFRIGYGHRGGTDYTAGDGSVVPGSFTSRDIDLAFSFDLSSESRIDINGLRLDQTNVDLPGQVNDLKFLITDAVSARYVWDDHCDQHFELYGWYNRTRFQGQLGTRGAVPGTPLGIFRPVTNGDVMSTGARGFYTIGEKDAAQLTGGSDYTMFEQEYNEIDDAFNGAGNIDFGIPRSHSSNPGVFVDGILPIGDRLVLRAGGRADWVSVSMDFGRGIVLNLPARYPADVDRDYFLWASYLSGEYQLTDTLTFLASFGTAQRAPTPTDLFAFQPFLGIMQKGGFFPTGSEIQPGALDLRPEFARQVDVGLRAEYDDFRGGVNAFYSWIDNFITYDPNAAITNRTVNHDSILAGGEAYGEYDLNCRWTLFGSVAYVEGRDLVISQPLWAIPPLTSLMGARYRRDNWGLEFSARVADQQNRISQSFATISAGNGEFPTPGFAVYNLRGYWVLRDGLTFTGGVENIGDKTYREHLDYATNFYQPLAGNPGVLRPGRNFYFGLEWIY